MENKTFQAIKQLVSRNEVLISNHGYDELAEDRIMVRDVIASLEEGMVLEDYPDFGKGPCLLLLQYDREAQPIHTVWGIPLGKTTPAVLITAYRPDPDKWSDDFTRRL